MILRSLKTKEDAIDDVVEDYKSGGKRIVNQSSSVYEQERKQLMRQYEQHRLNYIHVCLEARLQAKATLKDLKLVDLDQHIARFEKDTAVDRFKKLQQALQKSA